MLTRLIERWRGKPPATAGSATPPKPHTTHKRHNLEIQLGGVRHDELRYPPYDVGFPLQTLDQLLEGQNDLIERITRASGLTREDAARQLLPPIRRLASYLHLLPATATEYYRGAGGLLRLSLEIGLFSLLGANAAVFPIAGGVERRYYIHPKWCVGTFLAGMCSQLYRIVSHMTVVSDKGDVWPALTMSLLDWGQHKGIERYYVRWIGDPSAASSHSGGAFLVTQVVSADILQELNEDNHQVLAAMAAAVGGQDSSMRENPMTRIIAPVSARVIEEDLRKTSLHYGKLTVGSHLEPYLIDAMRQLVVDGKWVANRDQSPLWSGPDGTYLSWGPAVSDLINAMAANGFNGLPRDPDLVAEILFKAAVLQRHLSDTYWKIIHPDTGEILEGFVKFTDPDFLFTHPNTPRPPNQMVLAVGAPRPTAPASKKSGVADPNANQLQLLPAGDSAAAPTATGAAPKPKRTRAPATPAGGASSTPDPTGEAADAADAETKSAPATDPRKLLSALNTDHAGLITDILSARRENRLKGPILMLAHGVGISQAELMAHGRSTKPFIEALAAKNWLWLDTSNPTRHIHKLGGDDSEVRGIVLRSDIAKDLGFFDAVAAATASDPSGETPAP